MQDFIKRNNIKKKTKEEREKQLKQLEEDLKNILEFDVVEALKDLARIRGKDEKHYLD